MAGALPSAFILNITTFLAFDPGNITSFPKRIQSYESEEVVWSAAWPSDLVIELVMGAPRSLHFRCFTRPTAKEARVHNVEFCFHLKTSTSCFAVNNSHRSRRDSISRAPVVFSFDPENGASADFDKLTNNQPVPLSYMTCKAANVRGSIVSNRIFINDFRHFFPQKSNVSDRSLLLHTAHHSLTTVPCLRHDGKLRQAFQDMPAGWPKFSIPFQWHYCKTSSIADCMKTRQPFLLDETWRHQVWSDGALVFSHWRKRGKSRTPIHQRKLICTVFDIPVMFYPEDMRTSAVKHRTAIRPRILRPKEEHVELLNITDYEISLPCEYALQNYRIIQRFWTKDSNKLLSKRPSLEVHEMRISFRAPFLEDIAGNYTCVLVYEDAAGERSRSTTRGRYIITIANFPSVTPNVPSTVEASGTVSVTCRFSPSKTVTPNVAVCGEDMDVRSQRRFEKRIHEINKEFNSTMYPLDASVNEYPPKLGQHLIYKDANHHRGSNAYQISCIGTDNLFSIRKDVIVIIHPRAINMPLISFQKSAIGVNKTILLDAILGILVVLVFITICAFLWRAILRKTNGEIFIWK